MKLLPILLAGILPITANAASYIAVQVEGEAFTTKHPDWRVFGPNSNPQVRPDPDGSHASSASGRSYVELLPDTRVTHSDPLRSGNNFWNQAGTGPSLSYSVNIPEPGRYTVFVKAYSTGTEDNGIHVGRNNSWPASGNRMQWCSGKNRWTWSSAQRTNSNHCGTERTITLDFSFAGANTINFSAREDGFELDQFMLIKESTAALKCAPQANDQIRCNQPASPAQPGTQPPTDNEPPPANDGNTNGDDDQGDDQSGGDQGGSGDQSDQSSDNSTNNPVDDNASAGNDSANTGLPACSSALMDPDGDGYGWENDQTCLVAMSGTTNTGDSSGIPACMSANSDLDGDGWGWENNRSCLSSGAMVTNNGLPPSCKSADSDPDADGWGWEDNQSCRVR